MRLTTNPPQVKNTTTHKADSDANNPDGRANNHTYPNAREYARITACCSVVGNVKIAVTLCRTSSLVTGDRSGAYRVSSVLS